MTRFVLVRHGQTEWNRVERFRGRKDLLLDATGLRQALAAALRIKDWPVAAVYSSPLRRALETAKVIANQLDLPVEPLDGLIDLDFGDWQGLTAEEAAKQDGELYKLWVERPDQVRFPGGEGLADVHDRVVAAVEDIAVKNPDRVVVLVSHNVVCRVLLCSLLGLDNSHFWQVGQDVCAINAFEIREGVPTVTLINDTCHL
ncbi:MAG: histidine phosphatase family protein [Dehalococcoidia bacterium]